MDFGWGMVRVLAHKGRLLRRIDFGYTSLRISIQNRPQRRRNVRNFVLPIRRNISTHNHELRRTVFP